MHSAVIRSDNTSDVTESIEAFHHPTIYKKTNAGVTSGEATLNLDYGFNTSNDKNRTQIVDSNFGSSRKQANLVKS